MNAAVIPFPAPQRHRGDTVQKMADVLKPVCRNPHVEFIDHLRAAGFRDWAFFDCGVDAMTIALAETDHAPEAAGLAVGPHHTFEQRLAHARLVMRFNEWIGDTGTGRLARTLAEAQQADYLRLMGQVGDFTAHRQRLADAVREARARLGAPPADLFARQIEEPAE